MQELLIAKARRLSGWPAEGAALSLRKKNYLTLAKSYLEREKGIEPATLCLGSKWPVDRVDEHGVFFYRSTLYEPRPSVLRARC